MGSNEKFMTSQKKKFFQSGGWVALKNLWPPTKVLSKWAMGSTEKN
jgi:hypothetical protein